MKTTEELAYHLKCYHGLTYRCQINLEATMNNMIKAGLTLEQTEDFITDVLINYETVEEKYSV